MKLIEVATECAENRRKPLTEIAYMAGITASATTLRRAMVMEGFHRRVARKKPFLSVKQQVVCSSTPLLFH
jgi:hypothetical protein